MKNMQLPNISTSGVFLNSSRTTSLWKQNVKLPYLPTHWLEKGAARTGNQIPTRILYHILIRSATPQHQTPPRLNTCTEVSRELWQGQAFFREEILAAPNIHNMILKPLTEDIDLIHVVFCSLLCYHQKYSYLFSTTWRNVPVKGTLTRAVCEEL